MKKKNPASKIAAVLGVILVLAILFGVVTTVRNKLNKEEEEIVGGDEVEEYYVDEDDETSEFDENDKDETEEEETTKDGIFNRLKNKEKTSEDEEETTSETTQKKSYSSHQVDGKTYIDGILIVNKTYSLPSDYNPGVDPEAEAAVEEMKAGASAEGISLWIQSGFRSYAVQEGLYENYASEDGYDAADRYSARPGHSEHQTGLAFDLNSLSSSFGETPEGKWLAQNCWKYGFIIRYPQGKENITGYMYEPWHVRYLGKEKAKAVYDSGLTLEEYLGIDSKYAD